MPGVSSMSVDVHKYGNASKGVSVVAFRCAELRRRTYVPVCDGQEGLYVTPTMQGARGGAVIAQAWATMLSFGDEGYERFAERISKAHRSCQEIVNGVPGLCRGEAYRCACTRYCRCHIVHQDYILLYNTTYMSYIVISYHDKRQ